MKINFMVMEIIFRNIIFINVVEILDGGVFWEGLEGEVFRTIKIKFWLGVEDWYVEQGKFVVYFNLRLVYFIEY